MYFGTPLYWRETHKQPRFFIFDGRLVFLILLVIMHLRFWTVFLAIATMIILFFFERKGVSADSILRFLRARIVGQRRTARGVAAERHPVDFGFETAAGVRGRAAVHERLALAIRNSREKLRAGKKGARAKGQKNG